jgi:tetratricopeptide (TPR) repeat protein
VRLILKVKSRCSTKPSPGKFNLAVAALGNDPSNDMRRLILDELKQFSGVAALSLGEMIEIQGGNSEQAIQAGHERAHKLLAKMGADVMLWGEVIRHENQSRPRLYWTAACEVVLSKPSERYKIEDMALPELFWDDFKSVLGLIVASHDEELWQLEGHYMVDKLKPFVERVRYLAADPRWDPRTRAQLNFTLATALAKLGIQAGQSQPLKEAVAAYREALKERTRERVPLDWAMTQNNLGNALGTLGAREAGTKRLEEAAKAYRTALGVFRAGAASYYVQATEESLNRALAEIKKRKQVTEGASIRGNRQ